MNLMTQFRMGTQDFWSCWNLEMAIITNQRRETEKLLVVVPQKLVLLVFINLLSANRGGL